MISNALVALSGATVAQANGFADVGMGVGTIVIGLASVIIGEVLFSPKSFKTSLIAVILALSFTVLLLPSCSKWACLRTTSSFSRLCSSPSHSRCL